MSVLATVLGTLAALGMSRGNLRGAPLVNGLFLVPLAAPVVVAAIGIYAVFLRWHLTGTFAGFLLAHTALAVPFVLVPVMAALRHSTGDSSPPRRAWEPDRYRPSGR